MKRAIAILCVLACLCALCVPVMATAENVTIRAYVPSDWTEAYLYVWKGAEGTALVEWPGMAMTKEGEGWFSAEIPGEYSWAIVSASNGSQTVDLEIYEGVDEWILVGAPGADGKFSGDVWYEEPSAEDLPSHEPGATPAGRVTVHAQVPADWTDAYVYSWIKDGAGPAWPGEAMTKEGDWWIGSADAVNNQIIISNNGSPQTIDLTMEAGKEVWVVVTEDDGSGKFKGDVYHQDPAEGGKPIEPPAPVEPTTPVIPENSSFFVAGVGTLCGAEWDPGAEANKMALGASGKYEKVFENVAAGSYALKVTIGNWDLSWGGAGADGNYEFTMENPGKVTVLFDANTQTVEVKVDGAADVPATDAPTEAPTQAPTQAPETNNTTEQPKDNTALIIIIFVVVSAGAIGGALLYKKKQG